MSASIAVHAVCDCCGCTLVSQPTPVGATPSEWDAAMCDAQGVFHRAGWVLTNKHRSPDGLTTAASCGDCHVDGRTPTVVKS